MPTRCEMAKLTAAILGIHKARSLEVDLKQQDVISQVLAMLCELTSGVQFSAALLDTVAKGPEEELSPNDLSSIVLASALSVEVLGKKLDSGMVFQLSIICQQALVLNEELRSRNETFVSKCVVDVANRVFP